MAEPRSGWRNTQPIQRESITVQHFFDAAHDRFKLTSIAGKGGMQNLITDKSLHRPGLALAGYVGLFTYHRVQLFGNTEIFYLRSLKLDERIKAFSTLASFAIPCIIVTNGSTIDSEL